MKNLAAKLKGMNYKQAVIDHGEKLMLGLIGLFVLICLAGTSWGRFGIQPEEFTKKVEQGEANIRSSSWADKEKDFKSSRDIMQAVEMLHSELAVSRFGYTTNWYWPMYPSNIRVGEPKWLRPLEPIADYGRFVTVLNPIEPLPGRDLAVIEGSPAGPKSDDDDEFAPARKPGNDPIGAANPGAIPAPAAALSSPQDGGAAGNPYQKMLTGGVGGESTGLSGPKVNAQGMRFIVSRAVFPLGEQLDEFVKAMHESKQNAAGLVDFMDFEVERQVALPGDKPWSGKWEKVDFQATLEFLERIDFDIEVVDIAYTDPVFTMPLPHRVIGSWGKIVSHPLIKAMAKELVELQAQLTQRMVEQAETLAKDAKAPKKGFAGTQHDGRALRGQFSGGNQVQGMMQEMTQSFKSGKTTTYTPGFDPNSMRNFDQAMIGGFQDQVANNNGRMSKYLLLRYFDFQVNPGNAYRYRMRVTLRNPNFRRPVEELVQEETALVEFRVSPWSDPTPPVFVPNEERIFLAKADKAKIETGMPLAHLQVYQWFSEAGTTIAASLDKLQLGQFVGGRPAKLTEVFRPADNTLLEEDIPVFTGSVLADVATASTSDLDLTEHADLRLDAKKLKQLGGVDKALLVDRFGQLVTLDPKTAADEQTQAQEIIERERKSIRAAKSAHPTETAMTNDLDKLRKVGGGKTAAAGGAGEDPMMMMMQQQMGQGSPLKKGGAKGSTKKAAPKNSKAGAGSSPAP